jgi:hypothetical protein
VVAEVEAAGVVEDFLRGPGWVGAAEERILVVVIPALADTADLSPPPGTPLRKADRAYRQAVADLAAQASLGIHPRGVTKEPDTPVPIVTRNPS